MKKLRSQFLKISARSKIDGTGRAFFFFLRSDLVAVSCLPSFCFTWHLSDSFISPVIYLIFSPSLSRGGKLQGSQSRGPDSGLAGAS